MALTGSETNVSHLSFSEMRAAGARQALSQGRCLCPRPGLFLPGSVPFIYREGSEQLRLSCWAQNNGVIQYSKSCPFTPPPNVSHVSALLFLHVLSCLGLCPDHCHHPLTGHRHLLLHPLQIGPYPSPAYNSSRAKSPAGPSRGPLATSVFVSLHI